MLISEHALAIMAERGIAEVELRRVVEAPLRVRPGNLPGREVREGLAMVGRPAFRALLRVVVDSGVSPPRVVTVYATTQFQRYGVDPCA